MRTSHISGLVVSLQGSGAESLDLDIYDVIGGGVFSDGVRAKDVLARVSAAKKAKTINIRINSAGGDVFEGMAIFNTLAAHPARKVVTVDGIAASMASVIAMVGHQIVMPSNSMMMIHDPVIRVAGGASDLRRAGELVEKTRQNVAAIYSARTHQPLSSVFAAMAAETWMTASEARNLGYADTVISAVRMTAQWDLSTCLKVPDGVRREINASPSVAMAALYHPDNRFLIANFRRHAARALGKQWPFDPDEQRATISAYLRAVASGVGVVNPDRKAQAEACRAEMEKIGVPLMPPLEE